MGIQLGDRVRDRVTGYEGIAISINTHITGCRSVGVQSGKQQDDGRLTDAQWLDEKRLEVVEAGAVQFDGMNKLEDPGRDGPGPNPTVN